ncbi:hypothetical protein JTB14_038106 [Gonioctena quinquepunctata]|nr:hypothetical protein JTB14_038106 [Gonioctena quinquepunctata]
MNKFFGRLNNSEVITKLTSNLYGENQVENEKVDCFVMEKVALANRLIPGIPEAQLISSISHLVLPRIRAYLRERQISNIEDFIQLSAGIEGDTNMRKSEPNGNTNRAIPNNAVGGANANAGFRGAPETLEIVKILGTDRRRMISIQEMWEIGVSKIMEIVEIFRVLVIQILQGRIEMFDHPKRQTEWENLILPEFTAEQFPPETKAAVWEVISQFPDVFTETMRQPVTEASLHDIRVKEEKHFRQSWYTKMSEERKKMVNGKIEKLLEAGVIVPSNSEYCSFMDKTVSELLELTEPDPHRGFGLQTVASYSGIGAVLFQEVPEGHRDIIAYTSSKLNEIECLAVVWAIRKWKHFLQDSQFKLHTDSTALVWMEKMKDEKAKLARWALLLQEYALNIIHIPGESNLLPDFLSRNPAEEETGIDIAIDNERLFSPVKEGVFENKIVPEMNTRLPRSPPPLEEEDKQ